MENFLHERRNVFGEDLSEIGRAISMEHVIKLDTEKPIRARYYRLGKNKEEIVEQKIDEMLRFDLIEPSTSEYSSPQCPSM